MPVVYEQQAVDFLFASESPRHTSDAALPKEVVDGDNRYGFVGRDDAILQLERALHRAPAGLLIHGLGGVGKTTLAKGFVRWLAKTDGLEGGCFWFSFQDVQSAEFVVNRMVDQLFGTQAMAAPTEQKVDQLVGVLRQHRFLLVWDNFEVVSGIADSPLQATLPREDRNLLHRMLKGLRGGKTKVLITSRGPEDWLGVPYCFRHRLSGLHGEERWEYCERILDDFGLRLDRDKQEWKNLTDLLDGHPLAMRVILPELAKGKSPEQLINEINQNLGAFSEVDGESARLFATMRFVEESLPGKLRPLLIPLSHHEHYLVASLLTSMADFSDSDLGEAEVEQLLSMLAVAGLVSESQPGVYEVHPTLGRYLSTTALETEDSTVWRQWTERFVDVMGQVADTYAPKPLHEQHPVFRLLGKNFLRALAAARRLESAQALSALTQSLAAYALNLRNWDEAVRLFEDFAGQRRAAGDGSGEAGAYHQLGMVAAERRDYASAESWYRKVLQITEKLGDEHGAAMTYHQLGIVAQKRRDFASAERWYRKSLQIKEKLGNEHGAASTYHQLGMVAQERRDFASAESWYRRSIQIFTKLEARHELAIAGRSYRRLHDSAAPAMQARMRQNWEEDGLGDFPSPISEEPE